MKATISITGQISGNFALNNAIARNGNAIESKKGMFNSFSLVFATRKEAKEAIRKAYHELGEPKTKGKLGGVRKSKDNSSLYYDASKAELE